MLVLYIVLTVTTKKCDCKYTAFFLAVTLVFGANQSILQTNIDGRDDGRDGFVSQFCSINREIIVRSEMCMRAISFYQCHLVLFKMMHSEAYLSDLGW